MVVAHKERTRNEEALANNDDNNTDGYASTQALGSQCQSLERISQQNHQNKNLSTATNTIKKPL